MSSAWNMFASDEDDEKRVWAGNGHHPNDSHHLNGGHSVSLLSEHEYDKAPPLPSPATEAATSSSAAVLNAVSSVHRPFLFLLCLCSFFVTFRPSEPFLTPYLIDYKGL